MGQPAQNVVYRLDEAHDPAWQFHSMPESIGGGQTLDDALSTWMPCAFSLETDDLPIICEYVEREIGNLGIWLRIPVGQGDYDELLRDAGRQIDPVDRDWFLEYPTAGGDPVIVNTLPDSPLSSLLEQMSVYDSLILAMRYHGGGQAEFLKADESIGC